MVMRCAMLISVPGASGIPILLEPIRTHTRQSDSSHGISIALALLAAVDSLAAPAHVA